MAVNEVFKEADQLQLTVGASVAARSPVCVGQIPGYTLTATAATGTQIATVLLKGVVKVSVKAIDGSGNSAVAVGDILYWVVGDTPKVSKKATGVRFGYAVEAIGTGGATATISVKLGY